jgi:hypothetical protein
MTEIERLYRNTVNSVPERRRYEQEIKGLHVGLCESDFGDGVNVEQGGLQR